MTLWLLYSNLLLCQAASSAYGDYNASYSGCNPFYVNSQEMELDAPTTADR